MEVVLGLAILGVLLIANGLATRTVLRDAYSEKRQKAFQLLALWLVPVFGAIFIFALHRKPERGTGRYRESHDPFLNDFATPRDVGRSVNPPADD